MKTHPILFSAPMVKALLNTQVGSWPPAPINPALPTKGVTRRLSKQWLRVKKGTILWVRETWSWVDDPAGEMLLNGERGCVDYRADAPENWRIMDAIKEEHPKYSAARRWRPSIHMPRWACRIRLECLEDAREERLHDITEEEARLEGVEQSRAGVADCPIAWRDAYGEPTERHLYTYRTGFVGIWRTLHTKPGERWEDNPTLVRVGPFRRIEVPR